MSQWAWLVESLEGSQEVCDISLVRIYICGIGWKMLTLSIESETPDPETKNWMQIKMLLNVWLKKYHAHMTFGNAWDLSKMSR